MPSLLLKLVFDRLEKEPLPFFVKPIARLISNQVRSSFVTPQITHHFDYLEAELGKNLWFVSDEFTATDIQMSFPIELVSMDVSWPNLRAYLDRIHTRPAYQRALKRGGPFELSGQFE